MSRKARRPRSFVVGQSDNHENFLSRLINDQRFLAFLGLALIILVLFPLFKTYSQKRAIENEMEQIKADIARYEEETSNLQEMIEYLGSKQSLEAQARLNLNLKKPGETVVAIERANVSNILEKEEEEESDLSNLKKWLDYFLKPNL